MSPDGFGDGSTEENATELQNALTSENVMAGDTIMMLDGTYTGNYSSVVTGTADAKIIIKPKNYMAAIIDGSLQIGDFSGTNGAYTRIRNIRVYYSGTERGTWESEQGTVSRPVNIIHAAPNVETINCMYHDGGVGIGAWQNSEDATIYGNIVFNSGWADNVLGGSQNIYWQGSGKAIKHNVFAGAFKATFTGYSAALMSVKDSSILENVMFIRTYALIGSSGYPTDNIIVDENHVVNGEIHVGYLHHPNGSVVYTNNRIYGDETVYMENMTDITMSGNKLVATGGGSTGEGFTVAPPSEGVGIYDIDNNEYYYTGIAIKPFEGGTNNVFKSFEEWQAQGLDVNSSYSTELPTVNEIFVYPNEYPDVDDMRMGIVVIWNWAGDETVAVDLTDLGLEIGTTYRWRQAQDPLVDVDTWVCAGNSYTFPMTGHTVALPIGFDEELVPTQFPTFGCFIIEKT